jgi:hypothetical protein
MVVGGRVFGEEGWEPTQFFPPKVDLEAALFFLDFGLALTF